MNRAACILRRVRIPVFAMLAALMLSGCDVNNIPTYDESAKAKWSDVQNQYQRLDSQSRRDGEGRAGPENLHRTIGGVSA